MAACDFALGLSEQVFRRLVAAMVWTMIGVDVVRRDKETLAGLRVDGMLLPDPILQVGTARTQQKRPAPLRERASESAQRMI